MIARNFCIACAVVAVFAVLFSNLVNNQHKYGGVTRLDANFRLP
jgi:hypothetical protein